MDTLITGLMALGWAGIGLGGLLAGWWLWAVRQARQQAREKAAAERILAEFEKETGHPVHILPYEGEEEPTP